MNWISCYFFPLLCSRLASSGDGFGVRCPHDSDKSLYGYVLPGAAKPCITVIKHTKEMFEPIPRTFFELANSVCGRFPEGNAFGLNYLDLDEARERFGRFKNARNNIPSSMGNTGHKILLGWMITKFSRGQELVIQIGGHGAKFYRRTHPEIEDYIRRQEHQRYRFHHPKRRERLPVCGHYDMQRKVIEGIKCDEIWRRPYFHSFICESEGYQTCRREERRTRCTLVRENQCCPRTEYTILRNSTMPGEKCLAVEDKCSEPCDGMSPSSTWKSVNPDYTTIARDFCGNVTARRFWIPESDSKRNCSHQTCCVEEVQRDLGPCPCANVTCLHSGRCVNFNATFFKCICSKKYTGLTCEEVRKPEETENEEGGSTGDFWTFLSRSWHALAAAVGAGAGLAITLCTYLGYVKGKHDAQAEIAAATTDYGD